MKLKILHVLAWMAPEKGGVCQAVRTMIMGLNKLDIYNEVACLDDPAEDFVDDTGFKMHALGPGVGPWVYSNRLLPWLVENLCRFDNVIIHGLWLSHGYVVMKALKSLKSNLPLGCKVPKMFVMPHGMLDPYFQHAAGRKLKAIRNHIYWKVVEANLINKAEGLLFTCAEECHLAHQPFGPYHPAKEMIVGLGVNEPPPLTAQMRQSFLKKCPGVSQRPYILFLSRIHKKKGVDMLIKAYAHLYGERNVAQSHLEDRVLNLNGNVHQTLPEMPDLVIAGPGLDSEFGLELKEMLEQYPAAKHKVHFTDMLEGDAKWGAFYGCDVFVLPSHQENFGIAVVEALACGKPVLISDQVNIYNEIEAAGAGLVDEATISGTRRLLKNWLQIFSKQREHMQQQAKLLFTSRFSVLPAAERVLQAIEAA